MRVGAVNRNLLVCLVTLLLLGCAYAPGSQAPAGTRGAACLRHIATAVVEREAHGNRIHFGGISGLDWDPATNVWYLLSDDRSERAPARFYTAAIDLDDAGFKSLHVNRAVSLKRADGADFPSPRDGGEVADPEALRIDPRSGSIFWSSEGDRRIGINPFVREAGRDGSFLSEVPLPAGLLVNKDAERGSRSNLSLEGIAFTPDGSALWLAMEGPLYDDGPPASLAAGALARFTKLDRQGTILGQFAYPLDPIPAAPTGGKRRADNGVSEILAVDDVTLLVIERAGYEVDEFVFKFAVRIYETKASGATDVANLPSLMGARLVPMSKRLVIDLNQAGLGEIDNIEAAAWGPRLRNGNRTLVLASDDNFSANQVNQFIAFEVIPFDARGACR